MKGFIVLIGFLCVFVISEQASSPEDDHYWAAVVEYEYSNYDSDPPQVYTTKSLQKYRDIIFSKYVDPVDILVFSEYGLSNSPMGSLVPDPEERIIPCGNPKYGMTVGNLSCWARERQKYLVVNLAEVAKCPLKGETRPCAASGFYNFNSNVVFDREGTVIARYRKFNLYNEPTMNITKTADISIFDTDFGVKFGTFICFDLLFDQPALQLVRSGITDFVYPTAWFSDLPFLNAVQVQQGWAYANNVNFLVSGSNHPGIGSTGSGIYAGRKGRLISNMSFQNETKIYVVQVPKINKPSAPVNKHPITKFTPTQMSSLKTTRDHVDSYDSTYLPLISNSNYRASLCQRDVCCNFIINYSVDNPSNSSQYYRYKLAAGDTTRSVNGFADIQVVTCAIFACSGDHPENCATRFKDPSETVDVVRFHTIQIDGKFAGSANEVSLLPSNLDTSMLPLEVDEFQFLQKLVTTESKHYHQVQYQLLKPRSDLFTFAIWGRKYKKETSSSTHLAYSLPLLIVNVFLTVLYKLVLM